MATASNEVTIQIADEVIVLTGNDLVNFEADRAALISYKELLKSEAIAAEEAKSQAKAALLEKLGITAEEAALLLG
jgi:hypothetical protein